MNERATSYIPSTKKSQAALIKTAAGKSANRAEQYKFRSKSGADVDFLMSLEMENIAKSKLELFENTKEKWQDRHSIIAAPLGAEVYLQCERGAPGVMLGAPRFYLDEIKIAREGPNGESLAPGNISIPNYITTVVI